MPGCHFLRHTERNSGCGVIMKEKGHLYLKAIYAGNRKEISKEVQQIRIQKDDIYGYIVETENGRAYGYPTMSDLRRDWKRGVE